MKTSGIITALVASLAITAIGQVATTSSMRTTPQDGSFHIVKRGPNSEVWQRTTYETTPSGRMVPHVHRYIELASGLNFWDASSRRWKPSKEQIDGYPGGAIATNGQTKVIFASNPNTSVAIDMQTADGKRFQSHVVGLAYYDYSNGRNVLIAEVKDCQGVISSNQVFYTDAFTDFKADLVYTYRRSGLEQDLVLQESPPSPETYGLHSDSTVLQVLTEFVKAPKPRVESTQAFSRVGRISDDFLDFGDMKMGRGRAFGIGQKRLRGAPVSKHWTQLDGRTFLIEQVAVPDVATELEKLSQSKQHASLDRIPGSVLHVVSNRRLLPAPKEANSNQSEMKLAQLTKPVNGLVLDYQTESGSLTNYTFQGDTTYYIDGAVYLYGMTFVEGGAVLKYPETSLGSLDCHSNLVCKTGPYRPAVFTSMNDNSVGESISGSSGSPSVGLAYYLWVDWQNTNSPIKYLRFLHAHTAFANSQPDISDCQFVNCKRAVDVLSGIGYPTVRLRNVMFDSITYQAVEQEDYSDCDVHGAQVTMVNSTNFVEAYANMNFHFTNSLFVNSDLSRTSAYGVHNGFYGTSSFGSDAFTSSSYPFQTVGGGACYLADESPWRDAGTTNIDPDLLADLTAKTTYPPIVYSNTTLSLATTFRPQAQRDTDVPDLGYHYDPLDWVFGGVTASSNLDFTAGTAVGWFQLPGSGGPGYGLKLPNGVTAFFDGTATSPCAFVRYSNVQEGGTGFWTDKGWLGGIIGLGSYDPNNPAVIQCRFTRFAHLANDPNHFRDYYDLLKVQATDCEFDGHEGGYNLQLTFTNCLFYRGGILQQTGSSAYTSAAYDEIFRNCTFYGGLLEWNHWEGAPYWQVSIRDCSFDGTTFNISPPSSGGGWDWNWLDADYNAIYNTTFVQNADLTALPGNNNVYPANGFNWQAGPLGNYYQPTNSPLIDQGDVAADQVGLYHFTTQTNADSAEHDSTVDIGYHYVGVDSSGIPLDYDSDGAANYFEDANGNGSADSGETDWQSYNSQNALSSAAGLQVFTPLE